MICDLWLYRVISFLWIKNIQHATVVTLKPETYFMAEVHAVSLKLPTFWTSQPDVWFMQAEVQFTLRQITADETMYYYVLAALNQATVARFMAVSHRIPTNTKH